MRIRPCVFWCVLAAIALLRLAQSSMTKAPDIGQCLGVDDEGVGTIISDPADKGPSQIFFISADELSYDGELCARDISLRVKADLFPQAPSYEEHGNKKHG